MKSEPLGIRFGDRYRNIPEAQIVEMLILAGWADDPDSTEAKAASEGALQLWTESGLNFRRAANQGRLFDPMEVNNFMKKAGIDGRDGFLTERMIPVHRRMVLDLAHPSGA